MGVRHYGFTLLEVLVVTAVIGILSGIVLAALTNARDRSYDAAVKDNLANLRTQAGIFHDNNGHYGDGVGLFPVDCLAFPSSLFVIDSVANSMVIAADDASKNGTVQCTTNTDPGSNASAWSAEAPLSDGSVWCVDSEGSATIKTTPTTNGVCPSS
jgi:prepilin-type N-terminal cleavage/methylation domain-containing protein